MRSRFRPGCAGARRRRGPAQPVQRLGIAAPLQKMRQLRMQRAAIAREQFVQPRGLRGNGRSVSPRDAGIQRQERIVNFSFH